MSGPSGSRACVDASVVVRLFDDDEPERQAAARALFGDVDGTTGVVSADVLAEFYDMVTTRMARPLPAVTARRALADLADLAAVHVDPDLVAAAVDTAAEFGIPVRAALAVEAAVTAGCDRLLTEALPHGTVVRNLVVEDPGDRGEEIRT